MAEAALRFVVRQQLPIAVVCAGHGAGAHEAFELGTFAAGHFGHGFFQGHLNLGQRRNRHPQWQLFVEHMVFAHIGMGQHVVAQLLRGAQARAVAQHQPGVRAQHGNVVGDGLGVGGTHADVDHGDAAVALAHQVVARHLRQTRRCLAQGVHVLRRETHAARDHVARLDKGDVFAVRVLHLGAAQCDEFVDVKLVIGEQHIVLKPMRRGAGVVAQALQRIVDARRGEQRERPAFGGRGLVRAVGNPVVHGGQVRQVKHLAHQCLTLVAQAAFHVLVVGERKVDRNRLVAGAHLQAHAVVLQQQPQLLADVIGKQVRPGQGGFKAARLGHEAITQAAVQAFGAAAGAGDLHPHKRVKRPHPGVVHVRPGDKLAHGLAQVVHAVLVNELNLRQGAVGIVVLRRGDERRQVLHGLS